MARLTDVFVPGGLPSVTYNPRAALSLETRVTDYLEERHRLLSLTGPTKSGKTVLLKTVVPGALWLSGGRINTADDFWSQLNDGLAGATLIQEETVTHSRDAIEGGGRGGVNFVVVKADVGVKGTHEVGEALRSSRERRRPERAVAAELLLELQPTVVVDDFHYIPAGAQLNIIRGLKDIIFAGVPIITSAVPHRAEDAVRVEREMTGRVEQLSIPSWTQEELIDIGTRGFAELGAVCHAQDLERIASESFGSPFLMQDFCLQLCKENGLRETASPALTLVAPEWIPFFRARAGMASKAAFDLLARGPRQRSDRIQRKLKDGREGDTYFVVLAAIASTGPVLSLTYEELRGAIREIIASEPPQRHEVTRILEEMSKIAKKVEGEPVVDYDEELSTLHIADPFFAFYLRWGEASAS